MVRAVWVEYVADLEHLERLLDLALVPEDQPLDVVGVLAHALGLLAHGADDRLAELELLAHVVVVDQPVAALWKCKPV